MTPFQDRPCALCTKPMIGLRADAKAHPACARELRRSAEQNGGPDPRVTNGAGLPRRAAEPRQIGFSLEVLDVRCPECYADEFEVRLLAVVRTSGGSVPIGPRKMLTCTRCRWRGSAKRARDAA